MPDFHYQMQWQQERMSTHSTRLSNAYWSL
jgi:hypothetical protein